MKPEELVTLNELVLNKVRESLLRNQKSIAGKSNQQIVQDAASLDSADVNELLFALKRIDKGTYGQCVICRHDIPLRVLESNLTARLCTSCETAIKERSEPAR